MNLSEIREYLKNAREALERAPSDTLVQQGYVRNLIALAETELKIQELDKTDTATEKLVEIVRTLGTTADTLKDAATKAEKSSSIQVRQTNAIIFWTAALFLATAIMAWVGYKQMQEAQKLTKATQEQIRLEHRARVGIQEINHGIFQVGQPFKIEVKVSNTGRTPALNEKVVWKLVIWPQLSDIDNLIKSTNYHTDVSETVTYPSSGGTIMMGTEDNLTSQQVNSIKTGALTLYYLGTIHYYDIFGEGHFTNFCGIYSPNTNSFNYCSQHNDAN